MGKVSRTCTSSRGFAGPALTVHVKDTTNTCGITYADSYEAARVRGLILHPRCTRNILRDSMGDSNDNTHEVPRRSCCRRSVRRHRSRELILGASGNRRRFGERADHDISVRTGDILSDNVVGVNVNAAVQLVAQICGLNVLATDIVGTSCSVFRERLHRLASSPAS
jgi:hypothetical protein